MRILRHSDADFARVIKSLDRKAAPDPELRDIVAQILEQVRARGDRALLELTQKFGGPKLKSSQLRVSDREFRHAHQQIDSELKSAVETAVRNVRDFVRRSMHKNWTAKNRQGVLVGERFDPFRRVGIYIPAGTAPLVSTAVMTVTLAAAAGVPEIVVTTPASPDGSVNPDLLYVLQTTGATEVYKAGGAQAIAALAFGTQTIQPVLKIFGPGNAYVVEAKRQVFGEVAIDLLPGPSEILIIADDSATSAWVAADLLAQAEHGSGSWVGVISNSRRFLEQVKHEVESQMKSLHRQEHVKKVIGENALLILVRKLEDAVAIANGFAPEHLAIVTRDDERWAEQVFSAGAIFLGRFSPVVGGDFVAGPSHELPTGGAGKSFAGLTVDQFQRRTSIVKFDRTSLRKSLPAIQAFSHAEGLDGHGHSAAIRLKK